MVDIFKGKESYSTSEQDDKRYPFYCITCDDHIHEMDGAVPILTRRFKTARGAADWSKVHAKKQGWMAWTVTGPSGALIYERNMKRLYERDYTRGL